MRRAAQLLIFVLAGSGLFLFFNAKNDVRINQLAQTISETPKVEEKKENPNGDIPLQRQLPNSPEIIKAIYATGWTAGSIQGLNRLIDLIKKTELNAIVIDIKDYSGEVSYLTEIEAVEKYGKERGIKILRPN